MLQTVVKLFCLSPICREKEICEIFFNCYLAAPKSTLGHCRRDILTKSLVITAFGSIFYTHNIRKFGFVSPIRASTQQGSTVT